ncbi:type I-E CRISPR-associated endoribonuclease Cas2e [Thermomonas brevis]
MNLTVIIVRDVEDRYRGFLSSVMLEISPGVFTSPRMSKRVREQVWDVVSEWYGHLARGSIIMTWLDRDAPGGQRVMHLGEPPRELIEADGLLLVRRSGDV